MIRDYARACHTASSQTNHDINREPPSYADDSDSPDWTDDGGTNYTRNVVRPDGDLVGSVVNGTGTLQLTDLRGSVIGTASLSATATALLTKGDADEFGVPRTSASARYGWLGGKRWPRDPGRCRIGSA